MEVAVGIFGTQFYGFAEVCLGTIKLIYYVFIEEASICIYISVRRIFLYGKTKVFSDVPVNKCVILEYLDSDKAKVKFGLGGIVEIDLTEKMKIK